jgi:hypothetical protein
MVEICALASGSNGNCYYIGNSRDAVLIDAGVSCKQVLSRMAGAGLDARKVRGILFPTSTPIMFVAFGYWATSCVCLFGLPKQPGWPQANPIDRNGSNFLLRISLFLLVLLRFILF